MSEVTVRMPVHTSVGGSSVRIRLTNAYATDPVTVGHATVGLRDGGPPWSARTTCGSADGAKSRSRRVARRSAIRSASPCRP